MYTPEFHSYHTVILSDLDFVALNNENIFMTGNIKPVLRRHDGSIIISPAQNYISYGLGCGLVYN